MCRRSSDFSLITCSEPFFSILRLFSRIDLSTSPRQRSILPSILMSSIELSTSSSSSNTFGIQSAVNAYKSNSALYTQGCRFNNGPNCPIICQDPIQKNLNPYTLQNCMVWSALAPNSWTRLLGASLSEGSIETASKFSINPTNPDFPILANNVTQTMQDCPEEYCKDT